MPRSNKPITDPADGPGAWTRSELGDPHAHGEKAGKVRAMFAAIAGSYDLNNRLHSLGRDRAWRRFAVRQAGVKHDDVVVDVACGTGDLTQEFARTPSAAVVGIDFTRQMLDVAERKRASLPARIAGKITYMEGDAQSLPLADGVCDVVSIAFGIRNLADPALALREFHRVLRPGGRLIVLEFDRPASAPARWLTDFYCGWVMPWTATLISGDRSGAYRYLPRSVETFMPRGELAAAIGRAGFVDVTAHALTLGICVCYRAVKGP